MKKFFAFVVAFAMVLSLVTVPAMAENKSVTVPSDAADINEALNVEGGNIEFVSEGAYPWVVSGDAAMSGNAGVASSESVVTATVEANEGDIVQFDFKAWGEGSSTFWDHCDFLIDGNQQFTYGAYDNDWETVAYELTAGEHTLTWSYTKDSSVNPTGDYFMVDNVYVGQPVVVNEITVGDLTVYVGSGANLVYDVLPAAAFDKSVTFASADESIATVNANGRVTGVAVGETTVTVTSVANPAVSATANVSVVERPEGAYATVILNVPEDHWNDGSGYQMLLDADATAYGSVIPETGALTTGGDVPASVYANFEYFIPENADGALNTNNIVWCDSVEIVIPSGIYDWCITNPTPGDRMWIASSQGNVGGRYDDYDFEPNKTYEFVVTLQGQNDAVNVTITDSGEPIETETPTEAPT